MRFGVPLVALFAVVSSAFATLFVRQDIPECAATCLAKANTTCSSTDYSCLCNDKTFLSSANACIKSSCSSDQAQEAESVAESLCQAYGVTLTLTASATTSATASATSTQRSNSASLTSISGIAVGIAAALAIATV